MLQLLIVCVWIEREGEMHSDWYMQYLIFIEQGKRE